MKKKSDKTRRILAWIGIIVLVLLYVATFIASLIGTAWAHSMFYACLYCTVMVPVLVWVFIKSIDWVKGKGTEDEYDNK